jgi:hypothetical protein
MIMDQLHNLLVFSNIVANQKGRTVSCMSCVVPLHTGVMGSIPARGMDISVHLFCDCVVLCS